MNLGTGSGMDAMINDILNIVNNYVIRGLLIIGVCVFAVYFIINCIKYGKAEPGEEKQKAKKGLIGTGIGLIAMFACVWLLPAFIDFLIQLMPFNGINPDL